MKRSKKGHRPHLFLEIGFEMSPERSKSLPRGFWKCSGSSTPESRKFRGCASQSHHFRFTPSPKTKPKPSQTHQNIFQTQFEKTNSKIRCGMRNVTLSITLLKPNDASSTPPASQPTTISPIPSRLPPPARWSDHPTPPRRPLSFIILDKKNGQPWGG